MQEFMVEINVSILDITISISSLAGCYKYFLISIFGTNILLFQYLSAFWISPSPSRAWLGGWETLFVSNIFLFKDLFQIFSFLNICSNILNKGSNAYYISCSDSDDPYCKPDDMIWPNKWPKLETQAKKKQHKIKKKKRRYEDPICEKSCASNLKITNPTVVSVENVLRNSFPYPTVYLTRCIYELGSGGGGH